MTISELLTQADVTPNEEFEGEVKTNMMILGVATEGTMSEPADYVCAAVHVENHGAAIESDTEDTSYIAEGTSTSRTSARRTFSIAGKRTVGDAFQDWACSHKIKFGTGTDVVVPYVYFNALTGVGEQGKLTINVTSDGDGDANTTASFTVEASSIGTPKEFTYSAGV